MTTFPCIMFNKSDTKSENMTINLILSKKFVIIHNQSDIDMYKLIFIDPVLTSQYDIVKEALKIEKLFN